MKRILTGILVALFAAVTGYVYAANYDNPVSGIFKGSYGDTVTVEVPSVVSRSPDNLASGDLSFKTSSNTAYRGFNQLADLKPGDPIQVEYSIDERSKQMLATAISRSNETVTTTTRTTSNSNNTGATNAMPGQGVPTGNVTPAPATVGSTEPSTTTSTTTTNSAY
jgi:hypothetical protein